MKHSKKAIVTTALAFGVAFGSFGAEASAAKHRSRSSVMRSVQAQKTTLLPCYKATLKKRPKLAGRMVVVFQVDKQGKVTGVSRRSSTLKAPALEACLLGVLKTWRFEKGSAGRVTYPFTFSPHAPKSRKQRLGRLSKGAIQKVVRASRKGLLTCYEKALKKVPALQGRVVFAFTISAKGKVQSANIASSTMDKKPVSKCFLTAVRSWRFPQPKGNGIVRVNYPFTFRP
jgi:TonB family protein